jgi:hypothetical protein
MEKLTIVIGAVGSETKVFLSDGTEIENVRKVEIVSEAGKPTQAAIWLYTSGITVGVSLYKIISELSDSMAEYLAEKLGIPAFTSRIRDLIVAFGGKRSD